MIDAGILLKCCCYIVLYVRDPNHDFFAENWHVPLPLSRSASLPLSTSLLPDRQSIRTDCKVAPNLKTAQTSGPCFYTIVYPATSRLASATGRPVCRSAAVDFDTATGRSYGFTGKQDWSLAITCLAPD